MGVKERKTKMNNNIKEFIDKSEQQEFHSLQEMLQFAKENANVYKCHAPHLDENLQPSFELLDTKSCKNKEMCGRCSKCDYMVDAISEEGTVFSFGQYDLICVY